MRWFLVILLLVVSGCYSSITLPDGSRYVRFGNQELNGVRFVKDANGVIELEIEGQKSLTELAFDAGIVQGKLGGE